MPNDAVVTRNEDRSRYELRLDGELVGLADYHRAGDVLTVPHTEVVASVGGRGLGTVLVRGMLDDLRGRGESVVPACPFVAVVIRRHPEYQDLVA